ncbi:unnamed protein product [Rodentolepis nana]|uniref:G domain-containing protein n=1 Tax=Rodentolepis nana TaxID=102285 RepID=A0A0R3TSV4_RODNA|nr:unnamed protein product [Rodentolepis nana]
MIKSGILTLRTASLCQLQAYFSLRPYTREQRLIKAYQKQEERLKRLELRLNDLPIVFQSSQNAPKLTSMQIAVDSSTTNFKPPETQHEISSQKELLDQESLNRIYNLSDKKSTTVLQTCCAGCGANIHCGTPGAHGFLPEPEVLELMRNETPRRGRKQPNTLPVICVHCQLVNQHKSALNHSLPSSEYEKLVLSELNGQENTTILLVADMTNLPHSLVPLKLERPSTHKIVLIGNKVDQLPIDGPKYHSRWSDILLKAFAETSEIDDSHVSYVALVSALTGYGINKLLDFLLSKRFNIYENPVYIVGSTNTGKSSLFNRLLLSDFCKSEARESIHRATVSYWPGTTAGLLKFPLSRMTYVKRALRDQAIYTEMHSHERAAKVQMKELYGYLLLGVETRWLYGSCANYIPVALPLEDETSFTLTSSNITDQADRVRNSFQDLSLHPTYSFRGDAIEEADMGLRSLIRKEIGVEAVLDSGDRLLVSGTIDSRSFNQKAWCYDTPGLESSEQILNFLTDDQLVEYLALTNGRKRDYHRPEKRFILPRTFVLKPGLSMLLGRLGRIDVLASNGPVYLTAHTRLPIHIVDTDNVISYLSEYATFLGPGAPYSETSGNDSDSHSIPSMKPVDIEPIQPVDLEASVADVVLSGAGWVSVAGVREPMTGYGKAEEANSSSTGGDYGISLRAWTPGGVGVSLRSSALLPFAIRRRGERLLYLREFSGLPSNAPFASHSPP